MPTPATMPIAAATNPVMMASSDHRGQHLSPAGAERPEQAEFTRALRHDDRERVEDDEGPDEQRDEREDEQRGAEEAQRVLQGLGLLVGDRGRRDGLDALRKHAGDPRPQFGR